MFKCTRTAQKQNMRLSQRAKMREGGLEDLTRKCTRKTNGRGNGVQFTWIDWSFCNGVKAFSKKSKSLEKEHFKYGKTNHQYLFSSSSLSINVALAR